MTLHRLTQLALVFGLSALTLGSTSSVNAKVLGTYRVSNWLQNTGGLFFNSVVSIDGTYTIDSNPADRTSSIDLVESYGGNYTYHFSGPFDGPGWGPVPSQLPVFTFPGFPTPPPQFARFSILGNTLGPDMFGASFQDGIYVRTGYVTITQVIPTPEPTELSMIIMGSGFLCWARSRRRAAVATSGHEAGM